MRVRAGALASEPLVEAAAKSELSRSKSAVAAVVAGYLADAGARASVLLGPLTLLVAGVGAGGRAFDGRLRQPGLGARRPRGLGEGERAGASARVAVPTGVAALSVALAYDHAATLSPLSRVAVNFAREAGSAKRAAILERIARVGPAALAEATFVHPLLHLASPSQGGLLTPADFAAASDLSVAARLEGEAPNARLVVPWEQTKRKPGACGVIAADARGVFAALCYEPVDDGIEVPELELVAALAATPVRRGIPRVRPGTRIACQAPAAIRCDTALSPIAVTLTLGSARKSRIELSITRTTARMLSLERG